MSEGFKVVKRFFHWGPFTAIGRLSVCVKFSYFIINCIATQSRVAKDVCSDVRLCITLCVLIIIFTLQNPIFMVSQLCVENSFCYCVAVGLACHSLFSSSSIRSLYVYLVVPHIHEAHSLF